MDVFIYRNGAQIGPFDLDDLESQGITAEDYVWCKGMPDWMRADEAEITSHLFAAPTPEDDPSEISEETAEETAEKTETSETSEPSETSELSETSEESEPSEKSEETAEKSKPLERSEFSEESKGAETELEEIEQVPEAREVPPVQEQVPPPVQPKPVQPQMPPQPQYHTQYPPQPQYQQPYQQPQYQPYQQPYQQPQTETEPMPPCPQNYLWLSIISLICCCLPLGIVSLVYSLKVNSKYGAGDYEGAQAASHSAMVWGIVSVALGFVGGILNVILTVAGN